MFCPHLQLNRDKKTRRTTNLNVARYFKEIGMAALQALPILQAHGSIPETHPVLQHPAINNQHYRMYAAKQADYSMRLMQQYQLLETPVLGPVFTQCTPLGNMTSALATQDERYGLMTGAVISYAATTAAAYTQDVGVDLSAGAVFVLCTPDERDEMMAKRAARRAQQIHVAPAAANPAQEAAEQHAGGTTAAGPPGADPPGAAEAMPAAGGTAGTAAGAAAAGGSTAAGAGVTGAAQGAAAMAAAAAAAAAAEQAAAAAVSTPFAPTAAGAASYTPLCVEGDLKPMLVSCVCCKLAWCAKHGNAFFSFSWC